MKKALFFILIVIGFSCSHNPMDEKPSIILIIGDGMGIAHLQATKQLKKKELVIFSAPIVGMHNTSSSNKYITDSGAGGTAIATGYKTKNKSIGVDSSGNTLKNILEISEGLGFSSGVISTSAITHATPASFIAHVSNRNEYEQIAGAFVNQNCEVILGGGRNHFMSRSDNRNVIAEMQRKGYKVIHSLEPGMVTSSTKLLGLVAEEHLPKMSEGRGEFLSNAFNLAMQVFRNNNKPFFIMIEGSQIDWGGHDNNIDYIVNETADLDEVVALAVKYASVHPKTTVIVTADHETGGLTLTGGELNGKLVSNFSTKDHTALLAPVFAFGYKKELFSGVYDNTDLFTKMKTLIEE